MARHLEVGAERWSIIVGGCHRSGTSLVRRVLDAHPLIHCGPEITFFRDLYGEFREDALAHLRFATTIRSIVDADTALRVLGSAFVELHSAAARMVGKPRWADKSPDNAVHLEDWAKLLGSRWFYVHVVRDPLDTIASIVERPFELTIPTALDERIAFYNRYVESGLRFVNENPDRGIVIGYERLVTEPAMELDRLMGFVFAEAHDDQLAFNEQPHQSGLEDPKVATTNAPHRESIGRWRTDLSAIDAARVRDGTAHVWTCAHRAAAVASRR